MFSTLPLVLKWEDLTFLRPASLAVTLSLTLLLVPRPRRHAPRLC